MSAWIEIAERCEKADRPDRRLACQIAKMAGWTPKPGESGSDTSSPWAWCPDFTASVDAVLALIAEKLPGGAYTLAYADDKAVWPGKPYRAGARLFSADPECEGFMGDHATSPALALLAAFSRAMASLSPSAGSLDEGGAS
jgi:hypothetical protein